MTYTDEPSGLLRRLLGPKPVERYIKATASQILATSERHHYPVLIEDELWTCPCGEWYSTLEDFLLHRARAGLDALVAQGYVVTPIMRRNRMVHS